MIKKINIAIDKLLIKSSLKIIIQDKKVKVMKGTDNGIFKKG